MSYYIIIWRESHKEPHVDMDTHNLIERYYSFEEAKSAAETILKEVGKDDPWYFDYQIYRMEQHP